MSPPTVNPSPSLPTRHECPPLDDIAIPPGLQPISQPEYVCLDSVTAALENLNVSVPMNDIISAIREEESKLIVPEHSPSTVSSFPSTTLGTSLVDTPEIVKRFVKAMGVHHDFEGESLGFFQRLWYTYHVHFRCVAFCYRMYDVGGGQ